MTRKYTEEECLKALDVLEFMTEEGKWERICQLNEEQKEKYGKLLQNFKNLNEWDVKAKDAPPDLHNLKGKALEDLVGYLFKISGGLFKVVRNLRTCTNEIDDLITLTPKGKILCSRNMIDRRLDNFLGECKNYKKRVGVTYVGKFCSLMLTNNVKLGIMFSYHGVSGKGWSNAAGLIKKFYLHKEKLEERYCIIDFSYKEFESILKGKNLLEIIDEQIKSLQFDTDYSCHLSKHPAEEKQRQSSPK